MKWFSSNSPKDQIDTNMEAQTPELAKIDEHKSIQEESPPIPTKRHSVQELTLGRQQVVSSTPKSKVQEERLDPNNDFKKIDGSGSKVKDLQVQ